jgi:UDP-glucose 4-epimerase
MILITGGMGFIGLHTARRFLDVGEQVVLSQFRARREPDFIRDEIGKRVTVVTLDVTNPHDVVRVVREHGVTGIVHLAVPGLATASPAEDYRVNMLGLINVLEAARLSDVRRVTLASSIAVYTSLQTGPFHEDTPLPVISGNPTEAYKKAWDILALHWADRSGLEVVPVRAAGIYGPLYHSLANIPSRVCHAAAHDAAADFSGTRGGPPFAEDEGDFCYVKDCAAGFQLIQMAETLHHRVYNIGAGASRTHQELADAVHAVAPRTPIDLQPGRSPRARVKSHLDIKRAHDDVGYTPEWPIERAVPDYITWLRANPL